MDNLLAPAIRQIKYLREHGVTPKVVVISDVYLRHIKEKDSSVIIMKDSNAVFWNYILIDGIEYIYFTTDIEANYIKVLGD